MRAGTVHQKVRDGRYASYLDGRIRKIIFASVLADRERTIAEAGDKKKASGETAREAEAGEVTKKIEAAASADG